MLSVLYKLASAAIANRLKPYLDNLINKTQNGFVPGRYIGECTRLVFDIMNYAEKHNLPGMLVLIDFERLLILFHGLLFIKLENFLDLENHLSIG